MTIQRQDPNLNHVESDTVTDLDTSSTPLGNAPGTPLGREYGETAYVATGLGTGRVFIVGRRNVADDTPIWVEIATAAAVLLPDQRFTVGSAAYNLLDPGTATFTTIATGITGANVGTGTTLGAASATSRRLVEVQPLVYAENLTALPFVNVRGMGAAPIDTVIAPAAGDAITFAPVVAGDELVIENLTIRAGTTLTFGQTASVIFRNVFFDNSGTSPSTIAATVAGGFLGTISFEDCTGQIASFTATGAGSVVVVISGSQTSLQVLSIAGFSLTTDTLNVLNILEEASVTGAVAGGLIATMGNGTSSADSIRVLDSYLNTNAASGVVFSYSASPGQGSVLIEDVTFERVFSSLFASGGQSVNVQISDYTFISTTVDATHRPLPSANVGTQTTLRGNRIKNVRRYGPFTVPAAAVLSSAFYVTDAPNAAGTDFDAFADVHLIETDYGSIIASPIGIDTTLATFRYALFELPAPTRFEDGREFIFKNAGDPSSGATAFDGPVAITVPTGVTVDYMISDPAVSTTITPANYILLAAGQKVVLMADRTANMWRVVG